MDNIAVALGIELRSARLRKRWTRVQLVRRLPVKLSTQTIATYKSGTRQIPLKRLWELCEALDVRAEDLLSRVRASVEEQRDGRLYVDLSAAAKCNPSAIEPLNSWARTRLEHDTDSNTIAIIGSEALKHLAQIIGTNPQDIAARLEEKV